MLEAEEQRQGPGERRVVMSPRWGPPGAVGPPKALQAPTRVVARRTVGRVEWPPKANHIIQSPKFFTSNQGLKRVAWPPPPEDQVVTDQAEEPTNYQAPLQNGTSQRPWENGLSNNYRHAEEQPHYQQPVKTVYAPRPVLSPPPPPPPSTVTLRLETPISQPSHPVFASQPAVKRQEPIRMRGDQKWPPTQYKEAKEAEKQAAEEAAARARAAGKPRRVRKDYTSFFAQNALLPTYPGYKAPPGTQHYEEVGTSDL